MLIDRLSASQELRELTRAPIGLDKAALGMQYATFVGRRARRFRQLLRYGRPVLDADLGALAGDA
ncbi:hypothetical protein [Streptomyces canarius]